jgi:polyhydroxybutyrate depolymerase
MYSRTSLLLAALSTFTAVGLSTGNDVADESATASVIGPAPVVDPLGGPVDPAMCPLPGDPGPGHHVLWAEHEGTTRPYALHVPDGYDGLVPTPLVVSLHGFGSNAARHAQASGLDPLSEMEGFVTLYPEGFAGSWNAGGCCGAATVAGLDDVGYVIRAVRDASSMLCIDHERIYLTGTDNGGTMAWRMACEASEVFAAVAVISGELPDILCMPARPVSVIAFHAAFGGEIPWESAEESFTTWASLSDCPGAPLRANSSGSFCDSFEACSSGAGLSFCTVDDAWTGGPDVIWQAWLFLSGRTLY